MSRPPQLQGDLPESLGGKGIPTNAFDLMKELRSHERGDAANDRQQQMINRKRKQDIRRETIEKQLMAAEDYTFMAEGRRRLLTMEDRLLMEGEDLISFQLTKQMREESFLDFRQNVRKEAEERQRSEEIEREKKRQAAQKKREAIVERIRKNQEEEELRLREAADAKLRALESQKRLEEAAAEAVRADRAAMSVEDELSMIAEQLFLEKQEKAEWLRQEAAKMALWEKEQQRKDEDDLKKRKQKLLDLEEKKRKLRELRKTQDCENSVVRESKLSSARTEALKLSKQTRIQNKAKFVSKKRKVKEASMKDLFSGSMKLPTTTEKVSTAAIFSSTYAGHSERVMELKIDDVDVSSPGINYETYESLQSETELHCALKKLMVEKRGLRLQLMQKKSSATSSEHVAQVKVIQQRIKEIGAIEIYIRGRVDKLVTKEPDEIIGVIDETVVEAKNIVRSRANSAHVVELDMTRRFSRDQIPSFQQCNTMYHGIETVLRETNELVLKSEVVGLFNNNVIIDVNELDSLLRRAGLLKMKTNDFIEKLKQARDDDVNGYESKLKASLIKILSFLDKVDNYKEKKVDAGNSDLTDVCSKTLKHQSPRRGSKRLSSVTNPQGITIIREETPILESVSVPTLGIGSTKIMQVVDVDESVVLTTSGVSLSSPSTLCSAVKDTKWQEVKKTIAHSRRKDDEVSSSDNKNNDSVVYLNSSKQLNKPEGEFESAHHGDDVIGKTKFGCFPVENVLPAKGGEVGNISENFTQQETSVDSAFDIADEEELDMDDTIIDYECIEGWNECLHTTMATAAHHAAFYGYTQVLELLSRCFDVFVMDNNGRTPLFYASLRNNFDCVLLLVAIDPLWIEVGDVKGETCMHAAVKANGVEVLEFLLTCDVDSSIANNEGLTPAHLARSLPVLTALHEAGATLYCVDSQSRMPLWYACRDGLKENAELLCSVMPLEYVTWQDEEGNSPLHIACMFGKSEVVETVSLWLSKLEDFYILNKKYYTPAHVATTADVLRKLYEFGVDLWVADPKGRFPLFINSFQGRVDCVTLLIEFGVAKNKKLVSAKDKQGDTALHAACMCGHFGCVVLLLYWLSNEANKQGLTPLALAIRTKHTNIASLVEYIEGRRLNGESSEAIFQCSFDSLAAVTLAHGSRWTKLYDHTNDSVYFYDRVLLISQWDRPETYDESSSQEVEMDTTRDILRNFYRLYNQEKLVTINDILHVYKGNFADLFLQLAERYHVQDLSIFSK